MKHLLLAAIWVGCSLAANAELTLNEIRTASKNVLVAYLNRTVINANEVNTTNLASWKLNGQPVTAINKFVTEADACDHHFYLEVPTLVNGTTSYLVAKDRATDPAVIDRFKDAIKAAADNEIGCLAANAYPVGTPPFPVNAGTSIISAPSSGANLPFIRASASPPPFTPSWPRAANTTRASIRSASNTREYIRL